jgi:hypothetical protein
MVEFTETAMRHRCRNPKCRSKLPAPVSNEREAFCARGCFNSFYLYRCLICEGPLERTRQDQRVCRKARCRSAWRAQSGFGRFISTKGPCAAKSASEKPANKGPKQAPAVDRGIDWAIAVNRARIRAPRRVLDAVFGTVPLMQPQLEPELRMAA